MICGLPKTRDNCQKKKGLAGQRGLSGERRAALVRAFAARSGSNEAQAAGDRDARFVGDVVHAIERAGGEVEALDLVSAECDEPHIAKERASSARGCIPRRRQAGRPMWAPMWGSRSGRSRRRSTRDLIAHLVIDGGDADAAACIEAEVIPVYGCIVSIR